MINIHESGPVVRRRVLITGASSGIGRELALVAARQGCDVMLMARREGELTRLRDEIKTAAPTVTVWTRPTDVTDYNRHRTDVENLIAESGQLDIVIANAGYGINTPETGDTWERSHYTFAVNTLGAIATIEAAKNQMLRQGFGQIVGIASVAAAHGMPFTAAYSASKAALEKFLEGLRYDVQPRGISVTTVYPGFIATPMTAKNGPMPFLITADTCAKKIWRAIERRKRRVVLPWPWPVIYWLMKVMPDRIFDAILSLASRRAAEFRKNRD